MAGRLVESPRSLATTGDQHGELRPGCLARHREEFLAHRQASHLRAVGGKNRRVSSKLISARRTQRAIQRLVAPGTAFGSMTITGTPRARAASTGGPATYPPMLKTAAGCHSRNTAIAPRSPRPSRQMLVIFVRTPRFLMPPTRIFVQSESRRRALTALPRHVRCRRIAHHDLRALFRVPLRLPE